MQELRNAGDEAVTPGLRALPIVELSEKVVSCTVPDRADDGAAQIIRYEWDGRPETPGPLRRQYNAGVVAVVLENVDAFGTTVRPTECRSRAIVLRSGPVTGAGASPLKIDIHTHILPETWPDLRERYGYGGWVSLDHHKPCCARMMIDGRSFREIESNGWDPTVRTSECDVHGVDVQVLSTVPVMFAYWAKPEDALDLARRLNDHIAAVVRGAPHRFVGLGTVPLQAPDLAVRELERCVGELGLAGIEIGTHVNDWNLDAPDLFPVFEAAAALGAAVFVHPWDMMAQDRMPKYWLPWLVGMPAESSLAICSMIFGGVLERLPALRVAFAHGGGAFPFTVGRVQHGFDVRPDLCAIDNDVDPRAYLGRFYVDSLVHDPVALRFLIDVIGADRVALGSDYPFPLGEHEPGRLIESMDDLDERTRRRLLAGTALEFLGLPADAFVRPASSSGGA